MTAQVGSARLAAVLGRIGFGTAENEPFNIWNNMFEFRKEKHFRREEHALSAAPEAWCVQVPRIVHRFQRPLAVPRPGPRRPWAVSSLERREVQLGRRIRRAFIQQREGFILGKIKAMLGIGPCELNCQQDKKIKQDQELPELLIYPRETGVGGL